MQIDISYRMISILWASNVFRRCYYCYWWEWSSILKVLKVTSLQCLYNITKKKLRMKFTFYIQINIEVSTTWYYRFRWKWLDMSRIPKIGSWYLFNILRKKFRNCFWFLVWYKTFKLFYGLSFMFVVTCWLHKTIIMSCEHRKVFVDDIMLLWL